MVVDVVEHVGLGVLSRSVHSARSSLRLQRREESLHRALSQTLPDRLMLQTMPLSAINLELSYCLI
jgi:hypothetical protein